MMIWSKKKRSNIGKGILVSTVFLCLVVACGGVRFQSDDCDIDLIELESRIDRLVKERKIRPDQAKARKEDLHREWAKYTGGEISCKEFLEKANYHVQP